MRSCYAQITAYITKDGSEIRELMHPMVHGNRNQSLAEAIVQPGETTQLHRHAVTEEVYHVLAGRGIMTLGEERFSISVGDTVLISPGVAHRLEAAAESSLRVLCCCSPPYSHQDTELLTSADSKSLRNV